MKLAAALCLVVLAPAAPGIGFEADGLRIDGVLVTGQILEIRESSAGTLLASGAAVEPLASAVTVALAPGRELVLDPGVRLEREASGFRLAAHGRRALMVDAVTMEAPVALSLTETGWKAGERDLPAGALRARLAPVEAVLLESDAAAAIEPAAAPQVSPKQQRRRPPTRAGRPRMTRALREDPTVLSEALDTQTVRFLLSLSVVSPN